MQITFNMIRAPLKTKKFEAGETEKAQSRLMRDEHFEVEAQRRNSKFLEIPLSSFPLYNIALAASLIDLVYRNETI